MAEILLDNPDYESGHMHFYGYVSDDDVLAHSAEIVMKFLNKWNTSVAFFSLSCRSETLRDLVKNESATTARLYTVDQKNPDPNVILRNAQGMVNRKFVRAIVIEGIPMKPQAAKQWYDRFKYWRTTHEVIIGVTDDE